MRRMHRRGSGTSYTDSRFHFFMFLVEAWIASAVIYYKKWKYTPAVRSKISSKLIFERICVWYSDRAHYELCVLIKDIGRRLPLKLQCSYSCDICVYHLGLCVCFPCGIPQLQSDWSLSCDHGLDYASELMWEQQHQQHKILYYSRYRMNIFVCCRSKPAPETTVHRRSDTFGTNSLYDPTKCYPWLSSAPACPDPKRSYICGSVPPACWTLQDIITTVEMIKSTLQDRSSH